MLTNAKSFAMKIVASTDKSFHKQLRTSGGGAASCKCSGFDLREI